MCKAPKFTTVLDKYFLRKIHALKLHCPQQPNGCPWIGELGEVERHLDPAFGQCTAMFPCKFGCGDRLLISLLAMHHEVCERRPYRCQHCNTYTGIYADVVGHHIPVCPKYPVPCPKGCGAKKIKRASVKKHLTKCPLSRVDCKYKNVGCLTKVRRKDKDTDTSTHYSDNVSKHLEMAHSAFLRLSDESQRERDYLTAEVMTLKQALAYAEAELFSKGSAQQREDGEVKSIVTHVQSMETESNHVQGMNVLQKKPKTQAEEPSIQPTSASAQNDALQKNLKTTDTVISSKGLLLQSCVNEARPRKLSQSVALREEQLHTQTAVNQKPQAKCHVKEQEQSCSIM